MNPGYASQSRDRSKVPTTAVNRTHSNIQPDAASRTNIFRRVLLASSVASAFAESVAGSGILTVQEQSPGHPSPASGLQSMPTPQHASQTTCPLPGLGELRSGLLAADNDLFTVNN